MPICTAIVVISVCVMTYRAFIDQWKTHNLSFGDWFARPFVILVLVVNTQTWKKILFPLHVVRQISLRLFSFIPVVSVRLGQIEGTLPEIAN